MAQRPTLRDVAHASGYSLATVNRVARGGENVRGETARQIARAATRIGYHGRNLLERRAEEKRPDIRLGVVLHKESQPFYKAFANEIEAAAALGCDAFITGETSHAQYYDALNAGINLIYGGHYNTETVGVQALGEHLNEQFGLSFEFVDLPTGL